MITILHVGTSARAGQSGRQPHGSHTRRLTRHFRVHWLARGPGTRVIRRDLAAFPPSPVDERWIEAAFTRSGARSDQMNEVLAKSDLLVDELEAADLILIGAPMYNFGNPSPLKAWIDNSVRVGRTFDFDRSREGVPYWPVASAGQEARPDHDARSGRCTPMMLASELGADRSVKTSECRRPL